MKKLFKKIGLFFLRKAMKPIIKNEKPQDRRTRRASFLYDLMQEGFKIRTLTLYQYRINDTLDVYPTNAKWHNIKTNKRGSFHGQNLSLFVREYFKTI